MAFFFLLSQQGHYYVAQILALGLWYNQCIIYCLSHFVVHMCNTFDLKLFNRAGITWDRDSSSTHLRTEAIYFRFWECFCGLIHMLYEIHWLFPDIQFPVCPIIHCSPLWSLFCFYQNFLPFTFHFLLLKVIPGEMGIALHWHAPVKQKNRAV